jgi:hypothetical protein
VNAKQFLSLVNKGNSLQREDFQALVRLQETFPYFALPKVLAAKYERRTTGGSSTEILHWAAIQSPNRKRLKQLIEEEIDFLPPSSEAALEEKGADVQMAQEKRSSEEEAPVSVPDSREEILKRLEENLNRFKTNSKKATPETPEGTQPKGLPPQVVVAEDLIASIKRKEKKAILDTRKKEQNDLIKAFSKKSTQIAANKENQDTSNLTDLSKNSTTFNDKIVSESFAKLLVKQDNKQQAIEIYRKLILKFPDKSTYFAALIKELED